MKRENVLRKTNRGSYASSGTLPPVMERLERQGSFNTKPHRSRRLALWPLGLALLAFIVAWMQPLDALFEPGVAHEAVTEVAPIPAERTIVASQGLLPALTQSERESFTHVVKRGDTWGSIANRYGFSVVDSHRLDKTLRSFAKKEPFSGMLRVGQALTFFTSNGEVEEVRLSPRLGTEVALVRADDAEGFVPSKSEMERVSRERVGTGTISRSQSSFAMAARAVGMEYDIVDDLVDVFSDRINFRRDFRLGDSFSVVYDEKRLADGTITESGPVLAAVIEVGGKAFYAIRHVGSDGQARYFDREGKHIANTFLRYPVKFSRISSRFNKARFHPILKRYRPHNGVDFAAPTGTPVRSVADGVITFAGWKGPAGKMIKIKHTHRYSTAYLHLSRIDKGIRKGARVKRGERIGAVGTTGRSTGPHLHYSFYDRGRYVDPMKIKLPRVENLNAKQRISKKKLNRALATLEHYRGKSDELLAEHPRADIYTGNRNRA